MHKPVSLLENEMYTILWDFEITNTVRRPDQAFNNNSNNKNQQQKLLFSRCFGGAEGKNKR